MISTLPNDFAFSRGNDMMMTTTLDKKKATASQYYQLVLDTMAPLGMVRWCLFTLLFFAYAARIYLSGVSSSAFHSSACH